MFYVPPAFWGTADGDVRLSVPFNGNASTDVSAYAQGAGTNTGATISGNELALSGTAVQTIVWGPATSLGRPGATGWTLECFINWTSSDNFLGPGGDLQYEIGSYTNRFGVTQNAGKVAYFNPEFGSPDAGPSATNVLAGAGKVHMAMVHPAGAGSVTMRFYIAGVQVFTYTQPGASPTNANGTISVGKITAGANVAITIDDVRFTLRERYTGTSFTPPTSPL